MLPLTNPGLVARMIARCLPSSDRSRRRETAARKGSQRNREEIAMHSMMRMSWLAAAGLTTLVGCTTQQAQPGPKDMTFFVTSAGPGKGGDLGGVDGADRHCQALANAVGAGDRTWHAYLSTQAPALNDPKYVNARD